MQLLSAFLTAAFSKLFEFFATYVGKKVAIGGAVVATSLVLLTAFWVVMKTLVAGLIHQVSNPQMLMAFYALWPSNAEACLSAYWTAQLMAFVYREHREKPAPQAVAAAARIDDKYATGVTGSGFYRDGALYRVVLSDGRTVVADSFRETPQGWQAKVGDLWYRGER